MVVATREEGNQMARGFHTHPQHKFLPHALTPSFFLHTLSLPTSFHPPHKVIKSFYNLETADVVTAGHRHVNHHHYSGMEVELVSCEESHGGGGGIQFLELPDVVVNEVLSHLDVGDFLTMRQVCCRTKVWVETFSGLTEKLEDLTVTVLDDMRAVYENYADRMRGFQMTLKIFMEMDLKFTSFRFDIKDTAIFRHPLMASFRERFGKSMKKFKVSHMFMCQKDCELEFYESLTSLKSLEITRLVQKNDKSYCKVPYLGSLKHLHLEKNQGTPAYHWQLIENCPQLEIFRLPLVYGKDAIFMDVDDGLENENCDIQQLVCYLERWCGSGKSVLKCIDLTDRVPFWELMFEQRNIFLEQFVNLVVRYGIQLKNVGIDLLNIIHDEFSFRGTEELRTIGSFITGLCDLSPVVKLMPLPNLDSFTVDVDITSFSQWDSFPEDENLSWPKLKSIMVDFVPVFSRLRQQNELLTKLNDIKQHIFNIERPWETVESLHVSFSPRKSLRPSRDPAILQILDPENLYGPFPNLKQLRISGWDVQSEKWARLWIGLAAVGKIEEIILEDCCNLGDTAFFGNTKEPPVFLRLTSLKKFTIKEAVSPEASISDRVLRDVLRHMELKELSLCSSSGFTDITAAGLDSLAEGKFMKSYSRLHFKTDPSLFSEMELAVLKNRFHHFP